MATPETPATPQRQPRPRTILRVPTDALRTALENGSIREQTREQSYSISAGANGNPPPTIRRVPQGERSAFGLAPLPVEGSEDIQQEDIELMSGDLNTLMNDLGFNFSNDPVLYTSPDRQFVSNISDMFSPVDSLNPQTHEPSQPPPPIPSSPSQLRF